MVEDASNGKSANLLNTVSDFVNTGIKVLIGSEVSSNVLKTAEHSKKPLAQ